MCLILEFPIELAVKRAMSKSLGINVLMCYVCTNFVCVYCPQLTNAAHKVSDFNSEASKILAPIMDQVASSQCG